MSHHTQGPLRTRRAIHPDNVGGYDYAILDTDSRVIGEAFDIVGNGEHRPALHNATLWAAAPELLEALEALAPVDKYGRTDGLASDLPYIIDPDPYPCYCQWCGSDRDRDTFHADDCPIIKARAAIAKAKGGE